MSCSAMPSAITAERRDSMDPSIAIRMAEGIRSKTISQVRINGASSGPVKLQGIANTGGSEGIPCPKAPSKVSNGCYNQGRHEKFYQIHQQCNGCDSHKGSKKFSRNEFRIIPKLHDATITA